MSKAIDIASTSTQVAFSTFTNPAGILEHRTFGSSAKNQENSFYNVFGKPLMESLDISVATSTIQQEHQPKYT